MGKLIIFLCISTFIALSATDQIDKNDVCDLSCPRNFEPVCGRNNKNEMETFPNKCLFEYKQCSDKGGDWEIIYENSPCGMKHQKRETCKPQCTFEQWPVCGKNSNGKLKTFNNKCQFEWEQCSQPEEGWTYVSQNECVEERKDGGRIIYVKRESRGQTACPLICPANYAPVCARDSDGNQKQFPNRCALDAENCQTNNKYTNVNQGPCTTKVKRDTTDECPKICTREHKPVCAQDNNGNQKQFANRCLLNVENCQHNDKYTIVTPGPCAPKVKRDTTNQCPNTCTREFKPVCAQDNDGNQKQFPNQCALDVENCQTHNKYTNVNPGPCTPKAKRDTSKKCPMFCTLQYAPVCAQDSDGNEKQFPNSCALNVENCQNNNKYTNVTPGPCTPKVKRATSNQCPNTCTREFEPVCAQDNDGNQKQFPNQCTLDVENCQTHNKYTNVNPGPCTPKAKRDTSKKCPTICTLEYAPVCARDSYGNQKQFPNRCALNVENCQNNNKYTNVAPGPCTPKFR